MVPVNVRSKDASGGITVVKVVIAKIVVSPPGKSTKNGFSFHFFLFSDFYFLRVGVRKKNFFFFFIREDGFSKAVGEELSRRRGGERRKHFLHLEEEGKQEQQQKKKDLSATAIASRKNNNFLKCRQHRFILFFVKFFPLLFFLCACGVTVGSVCVLLICIFFIFLFFFSFLKGYCCGGCR